MSGRFADAVIVAAGASTRIGSIDKLAEPILGRPLLAWSVETMEAAPSVNRIVVVTRAERVSELAKAPWLRDVEIVAGGTERSDSVRAGVAATSADVVLVHDGARPLATAVLVDAVANKAAEHGAAVPVVALADSLKRVEGERLTESIDRTGLVRTQTPQGARRDLLLQAFGATADRAFTDEAALLQAAGIPVATVPGEARNVKVTDRDDLELVRALAGASTDQRVGFGEDVHGFGPEDGLMLGGVNHADAPRLHGHSDGDVVLHAVATAILSACGLGDLGRLFPSDDPSTAGIASVELVGAAVDRAREAGFRVSAAQLSIVGSRPWLGAKRLDEMTAVIGERLGIGRDLVSVTASTGNLHGPEGAGRVIRATALVTVIRR
jgi:2-C-methyl-D-erythritol 4-phosphate cytidylyltransferase / 2-C-methyl-D-erythritol 2,4-cyclodiphosphate synthase